MSIQSTSAPYCDAPVVRRHNDVGLRALQGLMALVAKGWRLIVNRHAITQLSELDDYLLEDVGVTRHGVRKALSVPPWQDPSHMLRIEHLKH